MTDTEITALAREYAEEKAQSDRDKGFPETFIRDMTEHHVKDMKSAIEFLLRRYCLVEKESVRNAYKAAEYSFNNASDPVMPTMEFHSGEMSAIESLFPDLEKEVEE